MALVKKTWILLVLAAVPVVGVGCGGGKPGVNPEMQGKQGELREIYDIYQMYMKKNNQRPPKQLSDLNQKAYQTINTRGFQALQKGEYIVVWGVDINKDPGAVLAYEKDAPKKGGMVIMANGNPKTMAADDLQAALKAK